MKPIFFSGTCLFLLFVFASFISSPKKQSVTAPYDSILAYVDVRCKNDTCKLLDFKVRREVYTKQMSYGRIAIVYDFMKDVKVFLRKSGKWEFISSIEWDFVSAYPEFNFYNNDNFEDLIIYGELDEHGNANSYVFLYDHHKKTIYREKRFEIINFDYDKKNNIYKTAHYSGWHKEAYQSTYKLVKDSLVLDQHIEMHSEEEAIIIKRNKLSYDTTRVKNTNELWMKFANTNWNY